MKTTFIYVLYEYIFRSLNTYFDKHPLRSTTVVVNTLVTSLSGRDGNLFDASPALFGRVGNRLSVLGAESDVLGDAGDKEPVD